MLRRNTYQGLLDDWKFDLIVTRAKCHGFHDHEIDDAIQEVVLDVLAFRYDPAQSNGATESTALTTVIDNRLRMIRRAELRHHKRIERFKLHHGVDESRDRYPQPTEDKTAPLIVDVREAIAKLPPKQQQLCKTLMTGETLADVARRKGGDWHVAARMLAHVRRHFIDAGLKEYLP